LNDLEWAEKGQDILQDSSGKENTEQEILQDNTEILQDVISPRKPQDNSEEILQDITEQQKLQDNIEQQKLQDITEQQKLQDMTEQQKLQDITEQQKLQDITEQPKLQDNISDVYPALKPQQSTDKDADHTDIDDDTIDENAISRDLKNNQIYVRAVLKDGFTKTGKCKKSNRVYNSAHPCPFCVKHVTNFSHHILSNKHQNEEAVKEIYQLGKDSKERKNSIQLLRLKGAHLNNVKVLERKRGEIFLLRRASAVEEEDDDNETEQNTGTLGFQVCKYDPCPDCLGWVLLKSIKRHQKTCCGRDKSKNIAVSKSYLIVQSDILTGKLSASASKALVEETFTIMKNDDISDVAKSDPLIVTLGNNWMLRNAGNKIMRRYHTSSIMRLVAKFKMALQNCCSDNTGKDMNEFLQPKYFDMIIAAAIKCSSQDDEEDLTTPSNAIKLGYDIKRMASAKLAKAIKDGNEALQKEAKRILKLMDMEWGVKVKKLATITLTERSFNADRQLPLPEDIQALATYLQTELENLDLTDHTYENFRKVAIFTLARTTLYNRRRCHEVQAMRYVYCIVPDKRSI